MNLPNKLTMLRIVMVPVVVLIYLLIPQDFLCCIANQWTGIARYF